MEMEPGGIEPHEFPASCAQNGDLEGLRATSRATTEDPWWPEVVTAWPHLPVEVRASIASLIRSMVSGAPGPDGCTAPAAPDERSIARQGIKSELGRGGGGFPGLPQPSEPRHDRTPDVRRRAGPEGSHGAHAAARRAGPDRSVGGAEGGVP